MTDPTPLRPLGRPGARRGPETPLLRVRSETDVLALVPYTLGFHPEDSVVLIAVGRGGRPFLARVDLPEEAGLVPGLAATLVEPAVRNGGGHVLLVVYGDDEWLAQAVALHLEAASAERGMEPVLSIRADGSRWYPLGRRRLDPRFDLVADDGVPYDLAVHELTTRAVVDGRVTYPSREDLAGSLVGDDWDLLDDVLAAHAALGPLPGSDAGLRTEAQWLRQVADPGREVPGALPPATVARVLRAVTDPGLRDAVLSTVTHDDACRHVRRWRAVVRASPEELVAPAAGLLAFCAWLAGDGALAWCAVERSLAADPDHTLARLVSRALEGAVPPSTWSGVDGGSLPAYAR